jgi:hypothetical protein
LSLLVQLPLRVNANARGHSRFQPMVKFGPWPRMKYRLASELLFKQRWLRLGDSARRQKLLDDGLVITLIRVAPQKLDSHDNLPTALKPVVDGITDALGLPNDRDPRISWAYDQRRSGAREYAVDVCIDPRPARSLCPTCGQHTLASEPSL